MQPENYFFLFWGARVYREVTPWRVEKKTEFRVLSSARLAEGEYTQLNPLPHEPAGDFDDFLDSGDEDDSGEPARQRQRTI